MGKPVHRGSWGTWALIDYEGKHDSDHELPPTKEEVYGKKYKMNSSTTANSNRPGERKKSKKVKQEPKRVKKEKLDLHTDFNTMIIVRECGCSFWNNLSCIRTHEQKCEHGKECKYYCPHRINNTRCKHNYGENHDRCKLDDQAVCGKSTLCMSFERSRGK